jgi:hypothetical protein
VHVNGTKLGMAALTPAPAFTDHVQMLPLRAGLNTLAFVNEDGAASRVNIDRLELSNGAPRPELGAIVPFVQYEAESGSGTGVTIGPHTQVGMLAANASGRRAVTLDAEGKFVEWTMTTASNALSLRYSLPDAAAGGGQAGSVTLYVDGTKRQALPLSSRNAWVYDPYPFGNTPSPIASRLFSEDRFLVGDIPAGAKLKLQRDPSDGSVPVTIDLLDAELAPAPYAQPEGSVSITEHGAVADDGNDDSTAIAAAIAAAKPQNKVVWIPKGTFDLPVRLDLDHITLRGAGPWHSILRGKNNHGGLNGAGDAIQLLDFALFGDQDHRDDSFDAGIDGELGEGSLIQNLWISSTKVGIWLINTSGAYVVGTRIRDTYADGVNLNIDASNIGVEHLHIRNTGDDGMAIWSKGSASHNRFKHCTVQVPYHASAIAVYGGDGHSVQDCDVADTVRNGAGIQVGTRHDPVPLAGTTTLLRNRIARASSLDVPNANCFGALWLFADTKDMDAPVMIRDLEITDSTCNAIHFSGAHAVRQISLQSVTVSKAGGAGVKVESAGAGIFNAVTVSGAAEPASIAPTFSVTRDAASTGW